MTEAALGLPVTVGLVVMVYELLLAEPALLVTVITPAVMPEGVTAVMDVPDITVNELAAVPLKVTAEVPAKPVPVIVTVCPPAEQRLGEGLNDVTVGATGTVPITK